MELLYTCFVRKGGFRITLSTNFIVDTMQPLFQSIFTVTQSCSGSSAGKESACNCKRPWFDSRVGKATHPLFLGFPGGSADKESALNSGDLGLIPGWEDPLEKGKDTHSSILAWRIPWTV